jgi:hypothetical protein
MKPPPAYAKYGSAYCIFVLPLYSVNARSAVRLGDLASRAIIHLARSSIAALVRAKLTLASARKGTFSALAKFQFLKSLQVRTARFFAFGRGKIQDRTQGVFAEGIPVSSDRNS